MRARCVLVMLGACNSFYGLERTVLVDAPGPDAAPRCPADAAPPFQPFFTQALLEACTDFTIHGRDTIAICGFLNGRTFLEGTVDGPHRMISIATTRPNAHFENPRLTPEGELLLHQVSFADRTRIASIYRRDDNGAWAWAYDLPLTIGASQRAGVPSRGPQRHVMIVRGSTFDEVIDDGTGSWTTKTFPAELDVSMNSTMNLSADGLRVVFVGAGTTYYAVRSSIDAPFSSFYPLAVEDLRDAFLTEDCARLYFSSLGSIFYVSQ